MWFFSFAWSVYLFSLYFLIMFWIFINFIGQIGHIFALLKEAGNANDVDAKNTDANNQK